LVIGISQSGHSADVRRVVADAREQGALTLGITNDPGSPLANTAAHHIALHAGEEKSVAATKTYTTELTAVAMLVGALTGDGDYHDALQQVPAFVQQTLETAAEEIPAWAQRYRYIERFAVIGRGYNYATAFEISLKIKELCYITGEEYSEADFRHGPIAMVQQGFPVLVVAPQGAVFEKQLDLLQKLCDRDAETLVISNAPACRDYAMQYMSIPDTMPEWLSPLAAVVPGQVFAMHLARERGLPLDQPRGLNKVTVTE
jgi:glucosamine--fructose-6-phosphate aminotransferase (isomerizing)